MRVKTWTSMALLLQLAAWSFIPVGAARAAELDELLRLTRDHAARSNSLLDTFGRNAVSANFFTKAMGDARHGRGKAGKQRR